MARDKGKIIAIKRGVNPNSSSLGADVTFFLFGAAAFSLIAPVVASFLGRRVARAKDSSDETKA